MECAWRTTTRASRVISSTNVAWKRLERRGRHPFIHPSIRSFIHSFIHSYIHTFIHLYIYTYIPIYQWHTQMGTCMHLHMRTSTLTRVHRCTHTYTCMCYHLHLHVCQLYICTQQPFGILRWCNCLNWWTGISGAWGECDFCWQGAGSCDFNYCLFFGIPLSLLSKSFENRAARAQAVD